MNSKILDFIEKCESWKVEIKNYHWSADSLSQHELCDDIASSISDFEDLVSEVEQSISGKIKLNGFTPDKAKETNLKSFVEEVISDSKVFLKELEGMGENYVGIKSECETFIGDMQRKLYLVNFTMKEDLKRRLRDRINESMPKNLANHDEVDKFIGRRPKTMKARINQIYRIVKRYGIDSKLYHDDHWQAKDDYYRAITSLGCEFEMRPCGNSNNLDNWDDITSDGGYCDYAEDGMPRSKQYAVKIMYDDGMNIGGYIKFMAAGRVDDPFSAYDTCMILWPKNNRMLENKDMKKEIRLTEGELKTLVKEAATKILSETPLNYDIDNFSGRWTKSEPSDEEWALADSRANGDYLDDPFHAPNSWDDDEWVDGDKDMENDYSWSLYHRMNNVGKSPVDRQHDIMNAAQNRRDHAAYWTDRDNERGRNLMNKWINGKRDTDELGDVDFSYDPYKYNESKKSMRVTEAELKQVIKEAATKLIREYGENVKNFVKRSGCAARRKTGDPRKDKENMEKWLERQRKRELKGVSKETDESIDIKPSKEGTFTAAATKHGKSVQGFASQVLNNKDDYSPAMVKKANFARNAKKWNKK